MANNEIKTRIKQRYDTLANWESKNPILLEGEVARVRMEDNTVRTKTGDGTSAFNSLSWDDKNLYDNNTATLKIGDGNVVWGGPNLISNTSPIDAAMIPELGANRFAFLPPDAITVEYSRDGGTTWIDYGLSDSDKIKMFSGLSPSISPVIGHIGSGNCTTDCKLRITITTQSNNIVYATIKKFVINISTGYATGSNVTIEHSTFGNPDNFYVIQANVPIGGWTGYNVINNFSMRFGGSATQIYNFQKIRLTFGITGVDESHPNSALQVLNIYGFGGDVWRTPSNMAKTGHIYSYDESQNAIFPSKVKSSIIPNEENDLTNKKYVDGKAAEKLDKISIKEVTLNDFEISKTTYSTGITENTMTFYSEDPGTITIKCKGKKLGFTIVGNNYSSALNIKFNGQTINVGNYIETTQYILEPVTMSTDLVIEDTHGTPGAILTFLNMTIETDIIGDISSRITELENRISQLEIQLTGVEAQLAQI